MVGKITHFLESFSYQNSLNLSFIYYLVRLYNRLHNQSINQSINQS